MGQIFQVRATLSLLILSITILISACGSGGGSSSVGNQGLFLKIGSIKYSELYVNNEIVEIGSKAPNPERGIGTEINTLTGEVTGTWQDKIYELEKEDSVMAGYVSGSVSIKSSLQRAELSNGDGITLDLGYNRIPKGKIKYNYRYEFEGEGVYYSYYEGGYKYEKATGLEAVTFAVDTETSYFGFTVVPIGSQIKAEIKSLKIFRDGILIFEKGREVLEDGRTFRKGGIDGTSNTEFK